MSKSRPYRSERRAAAATRTRVAILEAARGVFEERGWAGATVSLIARRAGVSISSIEAIYKTKATLLSAVLDYSIQGDLRAETMDRRPVFERIRQAPDARTMLARHASYVRAIKERAGMIEWVIEQAAGEDGAVAELWDQMTRNRSFGSSAAAQALMSKHGIRPDLELADAQTVFWLAIDSGTYRSLIKYRGLTPDDFEAWIRDYYERMLLR